MKFLELVGSDMDPLAELLARENVRVGSILLKN
jgi:hypothetical protein